MKTNREQPVGERRMDSDCEYLLELRTERREPGERAMSRANLSVGCDGEAHRRKCKGIAILGRKAVCAVPDEAGSVSFL